MDGSLGDTGLGVGIILSEEGHKLNCALKFAFKVTKYEVKCEALLMGFRLVKEMQARRIEIKSDSQLVINQINDTFAAKDKIMVVYLAEATKLLQCFGKFELVQISREEKECKSFIKVSKFGRCKVV